MSQSKDEDFTFCKAALHNCSFFDLISQSNEGFLTLQSYFIKAALLLDRDQNLGMHGPIEYGGASTGIEATDGHELRTSGHARMHQTPSLRTPLYTNHMANAQDFTSLSAGGLAYMYQLS
jgi:hypothetical protein